MVLNHGCHKFEKVGKDTLNLGRGIIAACIQNRSSVKTGPALQKPPACMHQRAYKELVAPRWGRQHTQLCHLAGALWSLEGVNFTTTCLGAITAGIC